MTNLIIQAIIVFILGALFYFLVDYLINKFNENKYPPVFTKDISIDKITNIQEYKKY
jgi:hypothetical protein